METLDEMINHSGDPRELKRALSVKMGQEGYKPQQISRVLNVSEQYVSKWKRVYESEGVSGLGLGYEGKKPYLAVEQRTEVVNWLKEQSSLRLEELRDYLEEQGGLSYHRSEAVNPKRDEAQVLQKRAELKKNWKSIARR
jgi:transposase